ncbi:sugar phosphate isomerase/epimerase family protein [Kineococcus sp. SYSU DK003]|uniref:sugar phosphate isomerase/epimerase family protein n=1 Tax=Kineococcus sp. SYSU DK003 TaxID=3383124 RepID=UPI003D7C7290
MLIPGLCSVTYRNLDADGVLDLAARAGLRTVEWGGDVHVPVGDLATARSVAARTAEAGLTVASYGSYFRAGVHGGFSDVLATAVALGAPRIRVWAGDQGSAGADRAPVVAALADAVRQAATDGVQIGTESHGGTLTDTTASTLQLLAEVDDAVGAPLLTTYWQPTVDEDDDAALAELATLLDRVSTVHVFSWLPGTDRRPLSARDSLWQRAFTLLRQQGRQHDALLEFVPGDDPAVLGREAATLTGWLNP